MSVGASSLNMTVIPAQKAITTSGGPVWFRQLVSLTITGTTATPGNMVMLVYRGSTLVASCVSFSGPDGAVIGDLDTNTAEMEAVFDGVSSGATRQFGLYLYDSSTGDLLGNTELSVLSSREYGAVSPIPPISDTTVFIGSFAFYNGKTYIRSATDGLYYEFLAAGSGSEVTEAISTTGITIPGSP